MSSGRLTSGQQFDPATGFRPAFTEQMMDAVTADALVAASTAATEVIPVDEGASRVRTYSGPGSSALLAEYLTLYGHVNLTGELPDVLQSIQVRYGTTRGTGDSREDGEAVASGTSANVSLNLRASAQGSMAVLPELDIRIFRPRTQRVKSTTYLFYIADNSTREQVLARVATLVGGTVHEWPNFVPREHHLIVVGQQTSLSVQASAQQTCSFSATSLTLSHALGSGQNAEAGVTVRKYEIPPTIHDAISIVNSSFADSISVTAQVHITRDSDPANTLLPDAWPNRDVVVGPISGVAAGNVSPTSLPATAGMTGLPLHGFYLFELNMEPYAWDHSRVRATVINFADVSGGSLVASGGSGFNPIA